MKDKHERDSSSESTESGTDSEDSHYKPKHAKKEKISNQILQRVGEDIAIPRGLFYPYFRKGVQVPL